MTDLSGTPRSMASPVCPSSGAGTDFSPLRGFVGPLRLACAPGSISGGASMLSSP